MKNMRLLRRYAPRNDTIIIAFVLVLIFLFSCVFSCAAMKGIPESSYIHIIENVPFYPQETYQCGPASLAGVLNYWGISVEPDDIAKEIFSESVRGTLNIDMALYAQRKGLNATLHTGSMEDLKKNIDSGFPVIVLVDYGISFYQVNHFMVITGYNEHGVIVNSGKDHNKFIVEKYFLKVWKRTDYWTLLIKK